MKNKIGTNARKHLARAALAALVTWVPLAHAEAQPHMFGMVGIAAGQTARISTVFVGNPDFISNPDLFRHRLLPSGPCRVELVFLDDVGRPLASATETLERGQSAFFDLPPLTRAGGRTQIRAAVLVSPGPCRDVVVSTMEIIDAATGRTTLMNPAIPVLSAPGAPD